MEQIFLEPPADVESTGRRTLKVTGRLTIEQAAGFSEALQQALAACDDLEVDLSGITAIDLSGLQLLCASHRSAEGAGKRFRLQQGGNEIFHKVTDEAGFLRHTGCTNDNTHSCIWVEERVDG
jgi:ABC-type transporter Mla MlaB component